MNYRVITDIPTIEKVVDLEIAVWGLDPRDAVPSSIIHAIVENGGVMLVAEDSDQLVGLCLGIPARRGNEHYLWSHMTGIHPDYQNQGVGYGLKQAQREWALAHGYSKICWTFDPLQRGNANFNIHRLRAKANIYHVNYYGEMQDDINAGLPSDRLEAMWVLNDARPVADFPEPDTGALQNCFLAFADDAGQPQRGTLGFQNPFLYIEIPADINKVKREDLQLALEWRLVVRESMQQAFAQGFSVVDFLPLADRWAYVLAAPVPWYMYVVECSDGSLYTGITLDIERRLKQHNVGKGATYTATRRPVKLRAAWRYTDQGSALKAEAAFKRKSREQKLFALNAKQPHHNGLPVE
jgi:predicted GNAT superfamily acetyltransferase/predicted GIY-YIG superfamily endonuclease